MKFFRVFGQIEEYSFEISAMCSNEKNVDLAQRDLPSTQTQ